MSTPGGDGPNLGDSGSDPYRGPGDAPQGGGGTPPPPPPPGAPNPYGGAPNPYVTPGAGAGPDAPMDGVSIAALVTAVLCCTGPVAVVLGIIGIGRTKGGQRRGRWMAVTGIVVGILATLAVIGAVIFGFWVNERTVTPYNAETGQCLDVQDGDILVMVEKGCDEAHDAEVVLVGEYDEASDGTTEGVLTAQICVDHLSTEDIATLQDAGIAPGDLEVVAPDPENMVDGDPYLCMVEPDEPLDQPLL